MNEEDNNKLLKKIDKLLWTYPEDLLPGDKHLLNKDFDALGRESAMNQLLWVAEIEASMTAMDNGRKRNNDKERPAKTMGDSNPATRVRRCARPEVTKSKGSGARKKKGGSRMSGTLSNVT